MIPILRGSKNRCAAQVLHALDAVKEWVKANGPTKWLALIVSAGALTEVFPLSTAEARLRSEKKK